MARYDSIIPYTKDVEFIIDTATDWETIPGLSFDIKRDDFTAFKIWAEIRRESGSDTVELRIQLTDGVTPYNSPGLSSSSATWDAVGPDSIDMSAMADEIWTCNVQVKHPVDASIGVRGCCFHREKA